MNVKRQWIKVTVGKTELAVTSAWPRQGEAKPAYVGSVHLRFCAASDADDPESRELARVAAETVMDYIRKNIKIELMTEGRK